MLFAFCLGSFAVLRPLLSPSIIRPPQRAGKSTAYTANWTNKTPHIDPTSSQLISPREEPEIGAVSTGIGSVPVGRVPSYRKPSVATRSSVDVGGERISFVVVSVGSSAKVRTPHCTSVPDKVDSQVTSVGPVWMPATKPLRKLE